MAALKRPQWSVDIAAPAARVAPTFGYVVNGAEDTSSEAIRSLDQK